MRNFLLLVVFIMITLLSSNTFCQSRMHQSVPDNDLWKEDVLTKTTQGKEVFDKIIDIAYDLYKPLADNNNETLQINKLWEDPTVNANCLRMFGSVTINMYGGLFRRDEITPEGFALVLCHELGHAYGGTPYLRSWSQMSAEGQADYYGAKECHNQVMAQWKNIETQETTTFIEDTCKENFSGNKYDSCVRGLNAGQSLGNLLATIKKVSIPDYETPDETVVDQTLLSYPETIQCRLDTYLAGVIGKNRPACWFKN